MADNDLRIRVDVETARLREVAAAIKQIKTELLDLPAGSAKAVELRTEMNALRDAMATATGAGKSFRESQGEMLSGLKELRNEGRLFNFAVLEMVRGLEGLATVTTVFSGASAASEKQIKATGTAMEQAIGAGLGLHFGLKAMGGTAAELAGPVGIAVAALVGLADIIMENNKAIDELANERLKQLQAGLLGTSTADIERKLAAARSELENIMKGISGASLTGRAAQFQFLDQLFNPNLDKMLASKKAAEDFIALLMKRLEAEKSDAEVMKQKLELEFSLGKISLSTFTTEMAKAATLARSHDQELLALEIERKARDENDKAEKAIEKDRTKAAKEREKELTDVNKNLSDNQVAFAKTGTDREIAETKRKFDQEMAYYKQAAIDFPKLREQIYAAELNLTKQNEERMRELRLQQIGGAGMGVRGTAQPELRPLDFIGQAQRQLEVWGPLIDNIRTGFQNVGESIRVSILDKLIPATSLFQSFVRAVLDGLMQVIQRLLEMALIEFVMNILVPGSGSILKAADMSGGGSVGTLVSSAGMGGGLLSSAGSLATMNHSFAPLVVEIRGVSVTRGMDIIHSLEATRPVYRKMGGVL